MTITLMTGKPEFPFINGFVNDDLMVKGVNYAVVDDFTGFDAAVSTQGQSLRPGSLGTVGIMRRRSDDTDLHGGLIFNPATCTPVGAKDVDIDFIAGVEKDLGFSRPSCQTTAKTEILARNLMGCTFQSEQQGCGTL